MNNDESILNVKSIGEYNLTGRGRVFAIESPVDCLRSDICLKLGGHIIIDGTKYQIRGIESFAIAEVRKGHRLGILV